MAAEPKYKKLAKQNKKLIEKIKAAKAEHDRIVAEANAEEKRQEASGFEQADWNTLNRLWEAENKAYDDWALLTQELTEIVESEYEAVPFNKPRRRGVERFWELADIR